MTLRALLVALAPALGCAAPPEEPAPVYDFAALERVLEPDGRGRFHADGLPVTGVATASYPNGMRLTTTIVDGYEDGVQRLFFEHGGLARHVPLRAGREHGRAQMWFDDGMPYVLEHFVDGVETGPQLVWNAARVRVREVVQLDDVEHALTPAAVEAWIGRGGVDPGTAGLWRAVVYARAGRRAEALAAFRRGVQSGHGRASDAVFLLPELRADAALRLQLNELWREHALESNVLLVAPDEPGTPLLVRLHVVDRVSGASLPDVRVKVGQTDAEGWYQRGVGTAFNPRISGFGRTDGDGFVTFRTVRPAHYAAELDPEGVHPAHLHVSLDREGYTPLGTEILFAGDPRLRAMLDEGLVAEVGSDGPVPSLALEVRLDRAR